MMMKPLSFGLFLTNRNFQQPQIVGNALATDVPHATLQVAITGTDAPAEAQVSTHVTLGLLSTVQVGDGRLTVGIRNLLNNQWLPEFLGTHCGD